MRGWQSHEDTGPAGTDGSFQDEDLDIRINGAGLRDDEEIGPVTWDVWMNKT